MTTWRGNAKKELLRPTLAMLPRVSDGLSFLYADVVRIVQTDSGVCAETETDSGVVHRVPIPTAALACLLLGPGTSITSSAMATLFRHGTTVVSTGSGGILHYGGWTSPDRTAKWMDLQARAYADDEQRLDVAHAMFELRFGEEVPEGTSIETLRALEGRRMRNLYQGLASKYRLKPFKRNYNPESWGDQDPVNKALSSANAALYGVVHSVVMHLGCHPGLGFVHSGKQNSFVYDIADLYKAETTIPLAFSLHDAENPESAARRRLRSELKLYRMIPRIVRDIQLLLDPDAAGVEAEAPKRWRVVDLWDPQRGAVAGGVNYGDQAGSPLESPFDDLGEEPG
ncbi:type I-E CRISPR-associated endonuclease Cas1e [Nocardiopsis sp. FIRDI 009]|uniref:type I-E CRISPR-associated endonuclease Cas1e n=1 Tax=Nocardiopsis sp. FIRDI 009 TaxID=714197 RepID=UPI000E22CF6C|nr:type I-E CRISPR-associated endonuclease Cas1e [Nocardiopsis sp. FIRDI 009]